MRFTSKAKYFTFGGIATAVLVPLAIKAVETIPVTFAEGDVISASVINNLLKRVITRSAVLRMVTNCSVHGLAPHTRLEQTAHLTLH